MKRFSSFTFSIFATTMLLFFVSGCDRSEQQTGNQPRYQTQVIRQTTPPPPPPVQKSVTYQPTAQERKHTAQLVELANLQTAINNDFESFKVLKSNSGGRLVDSYNHDKVKERIAKNCNELERLAKSGLANTSTPDQQEPYRSYLQFVAQMRRNVGIAQ